MNETLLWLILLGTLVTAILAFVLIIRGSSIFHGAEKEVREELRTGREEARSAAKELRDEVSMGLRSFGNSLSRTMESISKLQQVQLDGMTKQLKDLAESNQSALERIRTTFESRMKELRESNEAKFDVMRKEASESLKSTNDTLSKTLRKLGQDAANTT